jgi:protein-S-isoprenylcysteine O-methyltransferase Ste14
MRALISFSLVIPAMLYVVYPKWITWSLLPISEWLRWLSFVVGVLTLLGVRWVLRTLGCNVSETVLTKPYHQLITTGPYRWVRHPLYTAGIVLFCSIGLMQGS